MPAANPSSVTVSKAPRWAFHQKDTAYYQQISQSCFKTVPPLHPRAPSSNSRMHSHCSHTTKPKDQRLGQQGRFSKPLSPAGQRAAPAIPWHPPQSWVFPGGIPNPLSVSVLLGAAWLHLSHTPASGRPVPCGDAQLSHETKGPACEPGITHSWGEPAAGACCEELLRWVSSSRLPGRAPRHRGVSRRELRPFGCCSPVGPMEASCLPARAPSAYSPQVWQLGEVCWVGAWGHLADLAPCYHRNDS